MAPHSRRASLWNVWLSTGTRFRMLLITAGFKSTGFSFFLFNMTSVSNKIDEPWSPLVAGSSSTLQQVAEKFQGWSHRCKAGAAAPASRWGSKHRSQRSQEGQLFSPKSGPGYNRVNSAHSRARREKEAGGSRSRGGGAASHNTAGSAGRDRSLPTMATAVFVCPEGN